MAAGDIEVEDSEFAEFVAVHRPQLETSNIPRTYWEAVHKKIKNEVS